MDRSSFVIGRDISLLALAAKGKTSIETVQNVSRVRRRFSRAVTQRQIELAEEKARRDEEYARYLAGERPDPRD